ncbi:IniB N-terminal domain-containing protein [Amycolatopsis sp. NPDC005232]|uniref:IniB N-terminal domain-containing protein n=1 Tax=Amycolatopsis sp. NPDC005232 TaxID=3157027 RepID=UPI0033BD25DB
MDAVQNLHEFAMTLLSDPQAAAAYAANPQGLLDTAGLADVSPADVQDIMPLLADTAPLAAAPSLPVFGNVLSHAAGERADLPNVTGLASGLPNLSGVFETVSDFADQTGLNTLTHSTLGTVSNVVDHVAGAVNGVPIAGPVVAAGAIDLEHTVDAVGEHVFDGKLVGSAVDATTNHLGDALMPQAAVAAIAGVPAIGGPVSGLVEDVRVTGAGLLGHVNEAIGSTPVGVALNGGDERADFGAAGDLSHTLDHVVPAAAAVPALPALPAVPGVPAVPALPAVPNVTGTVGSVTHTLSAAAPQAPVVGDTVHHVLDTVGQADTAGIQHTPIADVADATHTGSPLGGVETHAQDLAHGLDLHTATDALGHLPLLGH